MKNHTTISEGIFDKVRSELNSDIWDGMKLNPDIAKKIRIMLVKWLKENDISNKLSKLMLLGSITGYQYGKESDIDVNVVLDVDSEKLKELSKNLSNGEFAVGEKYPINYHITNKVNPDWLKEDNGVYDLLKSEWTKKPVKMQDNSINNIRVVEEVGRFFTAGLDAAIGEFNRDLDVYNSLKDLGADKTLIEFKKQEVLEDYESLKIAKHIIWSFRGEAFEGSPFKSLNIDIKNSNESVNNMIYKYIERLGYFDKMKEIFKKADEIE